MTGTTTRENALVDRLEELASRQDRGALARLRAGLQQDRALEGLAIVLPYVARHGKSADRDEDDAVLVAGLFSLHPDSGTMALPSALRVIAQTSDSIELRFRALLTADRADLPAHLRHAVSLVASHGLAIDWRDLHNTVRFWDHPSSRSRRTWARAFWSHDHGASPTQAS